MSQFSFKGNIAITSDPNFCVLCCQNFSNVKILSLDEDNTIMELSPEVNKNVMMGTILLPPMEVMWAEVDGDMTNYNSLYYAYLMNDNIKEFIIILLAFVRSGGSLVIFAPEWKTSTHIKYLYDFLWNAYGIHPQSPEDPNDLFIYDKKCIPMYLIGIYKLGIITPYEFLAEFPFKVPIPDDIYMKLIIDINPYGDNNVYKKKDYIDMIRLSINLNGRIKICPIKEI